MRKMVRNRAAGEMIETAQTHWDEYKALYISGAFGFLLGGLTVTIFMRRENTKLVVVR